MATQAVCRLGDLAASPNTESSQNVFVNLKGVHRLRDKWKGHGRGKHRHPITITASKTVFVNSKPVARVTDNTSCGHKIRTGSPNTFSG